MPHRESLFEDIVDRVLVITMSTSERKLDTAKHLEHLGIHFEFFEGFDGNEMDHAAMLEGGAVCERYDSSPTPFLARQMGCYFSHLCAMIHAVGRGYSRVMICEDDVEFLYVPEFLRRSLEAAPPDADMLYLFSTCAPGCGLRQDKDRRYCNEYWRTASHEGDGAVAYIANARSISYLLRNAFPMRFTIDGLTKWPSSSWCDLDLRCYVCDPLLCGVRQVHSIICDQPRFIGRRDQ